ncbi:MAG: hypothetical protein K6E84_08100 [Lachnospiraceae bacterium]|nr:hypothetical protein [Lachnospiraceae bacterium]
MKTKNKIMRSLMSLVIAFVAVAMLGGVSAQAKSTYKYDSKKGVVWEPVKRIYAESINAASGYDTSQYGSSSTYTYKNRMGVYTSYRTRLYVAPKATVTVSSSSDDLLVKKSYVKSISGKDQYYSAYYNTSWWDSKKEKTIYNEKLKDKKFLSQFGIDMYAKKEGTYTVTVKIKKGKKTLCTKNIKVYATYGPFKSIKYADQKFYGSFYSTSSNKKSGKFKVVMNKTYKLKKIEVGTPRDYTSESADGWNYSDDDFTWKKFSNGKKLKLNLKNKQTVTEKYSSYKYTYETDRMYPITAVRITYLDTLTGQESTDVMYIEYLK